MVFVATNSWRLAEGVSATSDCLAMLKVLFAKGNKSVCHNESLLVAKGVRGGKESTKYIIQLGSAMSCTLLDVLIFNWAVAFMKTQWD